MSDDEHHSGRSYSAQSLFRFDLARQRKPQRSCDVCRQRKVRCDGPSMPDQTCSNCIAFGAPCTYINPYRKRGPKNPLVEELKKENASLKAKLRKLSVCSLCAQPLQSQAQGDGDSGTSVFNHVTPESDHTVASPDSNEPLEAQDYAADEEASRFETFSPTSMKTSYYGAASSFALANSAIVQAKGKSLGPQLSTLTRRSLYWDMFPWEKEAYDRHPDYKFPPNDLVDSLVNLYFANVHPTLPILHRPSFEQSVAEGLHLTNTEFGGTLLSVLAVASRYSNDPRVFLEGERKFSAGWKFADQLWILRRQFEPSIHQVQMYCMLVLYSHALSTPQVSWLYLGLGIRFLQQRGEHRRKPEGRKHSHEDELWNRAFWAFVALDRHMSAFLGRPMAFHVEEYDVEPLLEVDDEYWDHGFTQPPGQPSQLSYFAANLRLNDIMGDVMRRLYGTKKSKILMGWDGPDWEPRTVAELDSAVNNFFDSIPTHLRWNPESPPHGTFFDQAATLHITYNYVRIAIHRQYIQKATVLAAPSLSICAGAARAVLHTADAWLRKRQRLPLPNVVNPVFVSGIILVLNMLATKRAGLALDKKTKDFDLVATAMEILKFSESRLQPVGRLWELLQSLWTLDGSLPLITPPSEEVPADNGASTTGIESVSVQPMAIPPSSDVPVPVEDFFTQMRQSFEQTMPQPRWDDSTPTFGHSSQLPGMSVEQMFTDPTAYDANNIFDDELMSMWMAAPTDVANINNWDVYMDNRNGTEVNWFANFGAQQ